LIRDAVDRARANFWPSPTDADGVAADGSGLDQGQRGLIEAAGGIGLDPLAFQAARCTAVNGSGAQPDPTIGVSECAIPAG
jgi:hypothetical protein